MKVLRVSWHGLGAGWDKRYSVVVHMVIAYVRILCVKIIVIELLLVMDNHKVFGVFIPTKDLAKPNARVARRELGFNVLDNSLKLLP
jgi:hypothetical protein